MRLQRQVNSLLTGLATKSNYLYIYIEPTVSYSMFMCLFLPWGGHSPLATGDHRCRLQTCPKYLVFLRSPRPKNSCTDMSLLTRRSTMLFIHTLIYSIKYRILIRGAVHECPSQSCSRVVWVSSFFRASPAAGGHMAIERPRALVESST